jgi:hypothetical protein
MATMLILMCADSQHFPPIFAYCQQLVACITRVTDDLGESFTQADVEWLLQEHNVFEAVKPSQQQQAQQAEVGYTTHLYQSWYTAVATMYNFCEQSMLC